MLIMKVKSSALFFFFLVDLFFSYIFPEVETMSTDDDDAVPTVQVGGKSIPITSVNDTLIAQMTQSEKEAYIQTYQEYFSGVLD